MITIIDYGIGNLGSIRNMFRRIGAPVKISSDFRDIESASKLLLPGVGAFDNAISHLDELSLRTLLNHKALIERTPILGICLGMQLLMDMSEEGALAGLGWIPGKAMRIPVTPGIKVPHMGWDVIQKVRNSPLTEDLPSDSRFYFAHSYFVSVDNPIHSILRGRHGIEFDAVVQRDNIFGAQFHPEKSHRFGMRILSNFANL